jgi:hypothetical protein
MLSRLRRLLRRRPSRDELLNEGLGLAMDWGDSWLSPIQPRLHRLHPHLDARELEECNTTCQGAMRLAFEAVHASIREGSTNLAVETLAPIVTARYPWVDEENLARLLKQGTYYAAKMGGHGREA